VVLWRFWFLNERLIFKNHRFDQSCESLQSRRVTVMSGYLGRTTASNHFVYIICYWRRHCVACAFEVGNWMDGHYLSYDHRPPGLPCFGYVRVLSICQKIQGHSLHARLLLPFPPPYGWVRHAWSLPSYTSVGVW